MISKPLWHAALLLAAALLMAVIVAGCSTSGSVPATRQLPAAPDFAKPVSVPDPKVGEPALTIAGRERAGRLQANRIITEFRDWYAGVRADYAKD